MSAIGGPHFCEMGLLSHRCGGPPSPLENVGARNLHIMFFMCISRVLTPANINLTHYTKKQGAESLMTQPLIFIDTPLIDFGDIDMYNTDITF